MSSGPAVLTALPDIPPYEPLSIALGAFDGLHLGHMAVLAAARAGPGLLALTTFEPPPKRYFAPDAPPFRLSSTLVRRRLCAEAGVPMLVELPFDRGLAGLDAAAFMGLLAARLNLAHVAVGFDFRFGADRAGDTDALRRLGAGLGFGVTVVEPLKDPAGDKISSTRIRTALRDGDVATANALLGRPWRVDGVVAHGEARGRTIGFPTANLTLGDQLAPRHGVYAITVDVGDGVWRPGVANFGRTPTTGEREPLLEAHVFDWAGDLYGRRIETAFHAFLRPEQKFDSFPALVAQIAADSDRARVLLAGQAAGQTIGK
jgi:riboflavin kinase/FMN adenylyltransferase